MKPTTTASDSLTTSHKTETDAPTATEDSTYYVVGDAWHGGETTPSEWLTESYTETSNTDEDIEENLTDNANESDDTITPAEEEKLTERIYTEPNKELTGEIQSMQMNDQGYGEEENEAAAPFPKISGNGALRGVVSVLSTLMMVFVAAVAM